MLKGMLNLFVECTSFLSDDQYYALVLLLSLAFGCAVVLLFEHFQCWWKGHYGQRVLLKKQLAHTHRLKDAA